VAAKPRPKPGCPVCSKAARPKSSFVPFCSERCKMVDLGRWFKGEYVIAGEDAILLDPGELEEHLRQLDESSGGGGARGEGGEHDDDA